MSTRATHNLRRNNSPCLPMSVAARPNGESRASAVCATEIPRLLSAMPGVFHRGVFGADQRRPAGS